MWHGVAGHDRVVEQFRERLAAGRLASTYLFVGPEGIGKRTLAFKLAEGLLCVENGPLGIDPCGWCDACRLVRAGTHPDLSIVARAEDRSRIALEQLIGDRDHRNQQGMCHDLSMKPLIGDRKMAIIDDADDLQVEAANSLLKTLEEPPPYSVLILIGTSTDRQLPTILSRCQVIRLLPLQAADVAEILQDQGIVGDQQEEIGRLAAASGGSVSRASELANETGEEFRVALFDRLAGPDRNTAGLAEMILEHVNQAGREAAARRRSLLDVFGWATSLYQQAMRSAVGATGGEAGRRLTESARKLCADRQIGAEQAIALIERCLEASQQVQRNVHPTTLVESWAEEVYRLTSQAAR
ncbi:MAG: ATP-binding protein [Pirellulales bacterium]